MKGLLALLFVTSVFAIKTRWHELEAKGYSFEDYKREWGKTYESAEEEKSRSKIFDAHLADIVSHNRDTTQTWKKGVNQFTDLTRDEFKIRLGIQKAQMFVETPRHIKVSSAIKAQIPLNKDWRNDGVISTVKDQGDCGSCWSFCSASAVQSYWALATGDLPLLSEQMILDCTLDVKCGGTGGCAGATIQRAMETVISAGGIPSEYTYSYQSYFGANQTCSSSEKQGTPAAKISSYVNLPSNEQEPILQHLAQEGPLAGVVMASDWQAYEAGVFSGCPADADLDHGILIVGFGHDEEVKSDYWLIQNSWSPSFGEAGFIRIKREDTPVCGMDKHPLDGTGCVGGPSEVKVCGECGVLFGAVYPVVDAGSK